MIARAQAQLDAENAQRTTKEAKAQEVHDKLKRTAEESAAAAAEAQQQLVVERAKLQKSEIAVEELRESIIKLTGDKLKRVKQSIILTTCTPVHPANKRAPALVHRNHGLMLAAAKPLVAGGGNRDTRHIT